MGPMSTHPGQPGEQEDGADVTPVSPPNDEAEKLPPSWIPGSDTDDTDPEANPARGA
jgi:hypothetical protein